ncbi:MAG: N-acetylmuramoyl-L-alanine amidase [Parcubacteria group bacterium]|nr:N-acetylmuramoyl-L-alanine amidase [Parcubacteria group bacterium]
MRSFFTKQAVIFCGAAVFAVALLIAVTVSMPGSRLFSVRHQVASLFFADDITPEEIQRDYHARRLKVLIVPGHDNIDGGTSYKGKFEAAYTARIGKYLFEYLQKNPNIDVLTVRNESGYTKEFADYFLREKSEIASFIDRSRGYFKQLSASNAVQKAPPPMAHIRANGRITNILYGINRWANDNDVDIVLHLHLNDTPRKSQGVVYDGYSMYIPDPSFPNYLPSRKIAEALSENFGRYWAASNLHLEKDTIIEDSDLIAVGSYGSLRSASILLEYGYIYEPRFQTEVMLKEAAFRTYQGLLSYFGDSKKLAGESAWFSPYEWWKPLSYGVLRNNDVAAFQSALSLLGFYPPRGMSLRDCPVSGNFKECTKNALIAFQDAHSIAERGEFGAETREKLNVLFK